MKLLDIIPVTGAGVITPEMERYINQYLGMDTQMDVVQITKGTPSIECEYDEAMCAPDIIEHCIAAGTVLPLAFLLKMIFTAATLGAGFKGGEIVPSLCVGAAFGCLFGNLCGFSPVLCTAVGMGAVFCGVTNSPITSLLICFELFGFEGMPYYLIAIALSYMMSGYYGLYSSQKIIYSKYKTEYINRKTEK